VLDAGGEPGAPAPPSGRDRPARGRPKPSRCYAPAPNIAAIAADARGLVYALTELADRVRYAEAALPETQFPLVESPTAKIRSICRAFASEREDKAWFHDRSHWIAYLDMLVGNRFNRFALSLGMGYDYPYHNHIVSDVYLHFPYPYLVAVPGHARSRSPNCRTASARPTSTCCASSAGRRRAAASISSSRCGRNVTISTPRRTPTTPSPA
jgi:hypothetical protein